MAHVFIVNQDTLKYHLNYLFAGTGAKDLKINFLQDQTNNNIRSEKLLCGMIADISRIRIGDKILFYLQANKNHDGMFFGSFEATSEAFIDNENYPTGLTKYKFLPFRITIKPYEVYSKGATERNCLDSLKDIEHPYQMCWSLIYRKLKGNRGCTMITDYEYESIMKKIRLENDNKKLSSNSFSYDENTNTIIPSLEKDKYEGKKEKIDITKRLIYKFSTNHAFEAHLQAYIMQNLDKDVCSPLIEKKDLPIKWIGNEVSCGVGMQSIDCMFIQEDLSNVYFNVCELKDGYILEEPNIDNQKLKYINWIKDYLSTLYKKNIIIIPIIIARKNERKSNKTIQYLNEIKEKTHLMNLKYVDFTINKSKNNIIFESEDYDV